jgi:hypothetical protein
MFGSNILEVVIGMIFAFLLLSMVCSAVNEFIEALVKNRAKDLEKGIAELLGDPENTSKFIDSLYNHGMVNSLFKGSYPPDSKGDLPSYIPAQNFALAVMDLVKNPPPTMVKLPPNLDSALKNIQAKAKGNFDVFQTGIEDWYNSGMDRVSGWYKRRTQWILVSLGLIVAIAVNADAVKIARAIANDASLRQAIVATAQARAGQPITPGANSKAVQDQIQDDLKSLNGLGLPIGWEIKQVTEAKTAEKPPEGAWWQRWLKSAQAAATAVLEVLEEHSLGWILTAVAISMGAPFWFDLLNKVVAVRSSMKPQENQPQS